MGRWRYSFRYNLFGLSKAFDLVCHETLLEKLVALVFDSCLISVLKGFIQGPFMSVSVAGKLSQKWRSTQGSLRGHYRDPCYIWFMSFSLLQMFLDCGLHLLLASSFVCVIQGINWIIESKAWWNCSRTQTMLQKQIGVWILSWILLNVW